jgi:hypothetical protein
MKQHPRIYLQPIDGGHTASRVNLQHCLELQREHPGVRVGVQMQKVMEAILEKRV